MGLFKCCVGGCNATSETHRLFSFPKNDTLRNLWMSFLVPTNSILIGLSKEQLLRKRVCEKHFDKHQFDHQGKRLRLSYPCLFTDDEIAHGVPMSSPGTVHTTLSDHNYCKLDMDEDDDDADSILVIGRAGENFHEHPSCSWSQPILSMEKDENILGHPSCSNSQPISSIEEGQRDGVSEPSCSAKEIGILASSEAMEPEPILVEVESQEKKKCSTQNRQDSMMKKLGSRKKKFIKHVKKIASESLGETAQERLEKAAVYGNDERLFKNFNYLTKQAQTFLLMQLKQCRKNKMGRRFTLNEKLIALVLMKQSPKTYRLLENMFALPNKRTLNRLSEKITIEPGLNQKIFDFIKKKTKHWNTHQKLCTIVFDEIALTPHVTYNEKSDEIHGFVDVAGERKMRFCDHALVFMLRGVCSSWRQSVAFYFCEGTVSAAALQNILKQLVTQVGETGLIPLGLVCDQGSTFRTAIKAFRESTVRTRNIQNIKDDGTINISGHNLNVFFDPPHLLKGVRNNFINKDIIWDEKIATWADIEFIYDLDSKLGHTRALPKLTAHHVNPNKIKKMKVSVAAQVLSARTAAMLKYTHALRKQHTTSSMETTAEVVEFFDTLFDSVNCHPGGAVRGKLRKAVKINSQHKSFWTEAIKKIKKMKFKDILSKKALQAGKPRFVRVPSLEGWITTLESFIRIAKLLFEEFDVQYFYPRLINQDPLENFFGRIRAINYRNVNPDTNTFLYSFKSLLLANLLSPHSKFANCEVDNGDTLLDVNFLFVDDIQDENENMNIGNLLPNTSTSQEREFPITRDEVVLEKTKVQCSAYTAGFICRKISKKIQCNACMKTYISSSTEEEIYSYIRYREFKMLKNNNLAYPNSKFLIMYRDASTLIHSFLNKNGCQKNISKHLEASLRSTLRFSWLGCCPTHSKIIEITFIKNVIRLQVHNWCNILNKIMKGDIEEKYLSKMGGIQKTAYEKYKSNKLRKKGINK